MMTDEEHLAHAMLLGGTPWATQDSFLVRVRVGESKFAGCADFQYIDIETMRVVQARSEIDHLVRRLPSELPTVPTGMELFPWAYRNRSK